MPPCSWRSTSWLFWCWAPFLAEGRAFSDNSGSSPLGASKRLSFPLIPCEHLFVTAEAHAHRRFRRAIERRALWMAEDAARELPNLPLEDALQLVHLYAERRSPKYERAAMRWLERYLIERSPSLASFVKVARELAQRVD